MDAIAYNNGGTQLYTKKKHDATGIPRGEKKKARPKWCMDLFGRVVGGSPNLGGAGPFFLIDGKRAPARGDIYNKVPKRLNSEKLGRVLNIAIPNLTPSVPHRRAAQ